MIDFSFSDDAELQKLSAQVVSSPTKYCSDAVARLARIPVIQNANIRDIGSRSGRV
jgi:hypothetical protein